MKQQERLSVQEFLDWEQTNDIRHEYIGGLVYAMSGTSMTHGVIAGNIHAALHSHLRGKPCRPFMADLKVKLQIAHINIFYYPDIVVVCNLQDLDRSWTEEPKVIFEVLSETTEATDRREKFLSYIQVPSLGEYVLVAQDRLEITVFRRSNNWQPEVLSEPEQPLDLRSLNFALQLGRVYEGVRTK